jgi:hypothetical protein
MDVVIDGVNQTTGSVGIGPQTTTTNVKQLTFLRVTVRNTDQGVTFYYGEFSTINESTFPWTQLAFVDSAVTNNYAYGMFMFAQQFALLGTVVDTVTTQHVMRFPYIKRSVLSNNAFGHGAPTKHVMKLCGMNFPATGVYNEYIVVSNNKITGSATGMDWTVFIGPQNSTYDERIRNVIWESNWHVAGASQQIALIMQATEITVRNNIVNVTGALGHSGIWIGSGGGAPNSDSIRVYNNTVYSSSTASDFDAIGVQAGSTNCTIKNNLAYAPNDSLHQLLSDSGTGTVKSNNSTDTQVGSLFPGFVLALPVVLPANQAAEWRNRSWRRAKTLAAHTAQPLDVQRNVRVRSILRITLSGNRSAAAIPPRKARASTARCNRRALASSEGISTKPSSSSAAPVMRRRLYCESPLPRSILRTALPAMAWAIRRSRIIPGENCANSGS